MIILIAILMEFLIFYIVKIPTNNFLSVTFILFNTILYFIYIYKNNKLTSFQKKVFFFGIVFRTILLFIDRYMFFLPHSGADSEAYYAQAIKVANDMELLFEKIYGGMFSKILGIIIYFIDSQRVYIQSLNIILGLITSLLTIKMLNSYKEIAVKKQNILSCIIIFFPQTMIFSSVLLREMIITFLVTLSLYYCLKWIKNKKITYEILSIVFIIFAALFHAGVLFLIIGYILVYLFYNHDKRVVKVTFLKSVLMIIVVAIGLYIYINYADKLFPKIADSSFEKVSHSMTNVRGGSAYLGGKEIETTKDLIIFLIPKTIYFMFSPMPWDCRGVVDIFSFVADSLIYLLLIIGVIKNLKYIPKNKKNILLILLIGLLITLVVFGIGTMTAGTAIRHRHKVFFYIVVMYILSSDFIKSDRTKKIVKKLNV